MGNLTIDRRQLDKEIEARGFAVLPALLTGSECEGLIALYEQDQRYRKTIVMQNHGYGQGEYRYFDYPLPDLVAELRNQFYGPLSAIANRWAADLNMPQRYPDHLQDYTRFCHEQGQLRPTPLILKYGPGDYNRLHQDLYGAELFPLQMAVLLSEPGEDFEGGEFVLTEQRVRMQSKATVVPLQRGDAVIFAVNDRPVMGRKRLSRAKMRHGVSELRQGHRYTLGIIFHDAK